MQKEQNVVRVYVLITGLSLKKTPHVWLPHAKLTFYCYGVQFLIAGHMACDQGEIKYWLEMMTLNPKKIQHVSEPMELIFKCKLHYLWGYFRKRTGREDV